MREVDREFLTRVGKKRISELDLDRLGQLNQKRVAEHYRNQGTIVLDVNDKGFPDLIVILDKKAFSHFLSVEVKGGEHAVHWPQSQKLFKLSELGSTVRIARVVDHLDENKWRIIEEEPPLQETLGAPSKQDDKAP